MRFGGFIGLFCNLKCLLVYFVTEIKGIIGIGWLRLVKFDLSVV